MNKDCLIELGTEELPPGSLQTLSRGFADLVTAALTGYGLAPAAVEVFASPRRLAMLLKDTPQQQQDQSIDKRGPALDCAFDDDGNPSKAALGFARTGGV